MATQKHDKTQLSPREAQIQQLREQGLGNPEIAEQLGLKVTTVRARVRSINARKLSVVSVESKKPPC